MLINTAGTQNTEGKNVDAQQFNKKSECLNLPFLVTALSMWSFFLKTLLSLFYLRYTRKKLWDDKQVSLQIFRYADWQMQIRFDNFLKSLQILLQSS